MSFQLGRIAPSWAVRAAIASTGVVVLLAFLAGAAHGVGTSDRDYTFSLADPPWVQAMLPALDTPFAMPWSPSALAGRGSMAIALGRRTALRDFAAASAAIAIAMFGAWLTGMGVPAYPVILTMLGMAAGSTFWWRGVFWTADTLSPALALAAAWAGWRWLNAPRRVFAGAALLAMALALAEDPAWLACVPGAAALTWSRLESRAGRLRAVAALAATSAFAVLPVLARAALAHRTPWAILTSAQPPGALSLWIGTAVGVHPSSMGAVVTGLSREFTPLGVVLVMIGWVVLLRLRHHRAAVATLGAGLLGWLWFVPRSGIELVSTPLTVCGWGAAAVALAWLQQTLRPRSGLALVAVVGLVVMGEPSLTRARMLDLGRTDRAEAQAMMAYSFRVNDLPPHAAIIAEGRRVDAAILLSSQISGPPALIVPQVAEEVASVAARGRTVFAFASGRAQLDRLGFLFERSFAGASEMAVMTGQVPCAALEPGRWTDVSLLMANGSFILHGASPDAAPGGINIRLTDPQPIRFASIEPRSIPFELGTIVHDAAVGIAELDQAAARRGVWDVTALRNRETGRRSPVTFTFAAAPPVAVATADGPTPVKLCPGVAPTDPTIGRTETAAATVRMAASTPFGPGWHSPEADPDPFRWTSAPNSSIRVSVAPPGPIHLTITASPAARPAQQPAIALAVNACTFPARPMPPGQGDYEWDVPAACWRVGANQIWLSVTPLVSPQSLTGSHDTRLLGARVGAVRLARIANRNAK